MTTKKAPAKKTAAKKTTKAPKVDIPADTLSVSDVAREIGIDPKKARGALQRSGRGADGTRYPRVVRDSDERTKLMLFFGGNTDGVDSSP